MKLDARGHVAIEFALIAPYLLAFIYVIIEIAHYEYLRTMLTNIAHDSARYAIVHGANAATPLQSTAIASYATTEMTSQGLSAQGVTVTATNGNQPDSQITVTISYPYVPYAARFKPLLFAPLPSTIAAQAAMVVAQ